MICHENIEGVADPMHSLVSRSMLGQVIVFGLA